VRTALALLATIACGLLAAMNLVLFAIVVITKATILFDNGRSLLPIAILGGNAFSLGWLALQASRRIAPRTASAQH
jgi:hypothetical protein